MKYTILWGTDILRPSSEAESLLTVPCLQNRAEFQTDSRRGWRNTVCAATCSTLQIIFSAGPDIVSKLYPKADSHLPSKLFSVTNLDSFASWIWISAPYAKNCHSYLGKNVELPSVARSSIHVTTSGLWITR